MSVESEFRSAPTEMVVPDDLAKAVKRLTLAVVLAATVLTSCASASAPVRVLFTVARGGTFTPVRGAIDPRDGRPDLGPYHIGGAR